MTRSAGSRRSVAAPHLTRRTLIASAGCLGALRPAAASEPLDLGAAYARAYAQADATRGLTGALPARLPEAVAAELRRGRVIFVGGFLKQLAEAIAALLARPVGLGGYFDAQREALLLQGIDAVELEVHSEGSVIRNAPMVADAIAAAPGPVTLVTHSKGSLDTLQALIDRPGLATPERLRAWISLQAPFYGSPLADLNTGNPLARPVTGYLIERAFGGSPGVLADLAVATRENYQTQHSAAIAAVVRAVPTLCYASWLTEGMPSLFRATWLICRLEGAERNDGMVGVASAHLPGALRVDQAGVDHAMAVMRMPGTGSFDPVSCLTALLSLVVS